MNNLAYTNDAHGVLPEKHSNISLKQLYSEIVSEKFDFRFKLKKKTKMSYYLNCDIELYFIGDGGRR